MRRFVDEVTVRLKAGKGGPGCVSFRREKYIPFGGPNGGDGGQGGSVIVEADRRILNLGHLRPNKLYKAQSGQPGQGQDKTGKDGRPVILKVPVGTQIVREDTGELLCDLREEGTVELFQGGRGGRGNAFFKTSVRQTPRHAQPGEETPEVPVRLKLKMIADVGLIGLPNAGKSTLLKRLTTADVKIGDYPFTTLTPNLGVIQDETGRVLLADIPGIIEGASKGHGLGLSFLKHIERVGLLIFVLDITSANVHDELRILRQELDEYNPELRKRPYFILLNKVDLLDDEEFIREWADSFRSEGEKVLTASAFTGAGLPEVRDEILAMRESPIYS